MGVTGSVARNSSVSQQQWERFLVVRALGGHHTPLNKNLTGFALEASLLPEIWIVVIAATKILVVFSQERCYFLRCHYVSTHISYAQRNRANIFLYFFNSLQDFSPASVNIYAEDMLPLRFFNTRPLNFPYAWASPFVFYFGYHAPRMLVTPQGNFSCTYSVLATTRVLEISELIPLCGVYFTLHYVVAY